MQNTLKFGGIVNHRHNNLTNEKVELKSSQQERYTLVDNEGPEVWRVQDMGASTTIMKLPQSQQTGPKTDRLRMLLEDILSDNIRCPIADSGLIALLQ